MVALVAVPAAQSCSDPDTPDRSHVPRCPQVPVTPLPAFPTAEEEDDGADAELDTQAMVRAQNQKKKKSGGFQSMGVCEAGDNCPWDGDCPLLPTPPHLSLFP